MPRIYDDQEEDVLSDIGGFLLNPVGTIAGGIGHLLGGGSPPPPPRPPLPQVSAPPQVTGINTATLTTPQGNATLRLPSDVVSTADFQRVTSDLQDNINRATARLNTVDRSLTDFGSRLTAAIADTSRDVAAVRRSQTETAARLRREMSDQQSMNLMMSLMMQMSLSRRVSALEADDPKITSPGDNTSMMMMLPLAFTPQEGDRDGDRDGGSNNMMMMMVMLAASGAFGSSGK